MCGGITNYSIHSPHHHLFHFFVDFCTLPMLSFVLSDPLQQHLQVPWPVQRIHPLHLVILQLHLLMDLKSIVHQDPPCHHQFESWVCHWLFSNHWNLVANNYNHNILVCRNDFRLISDIFVMSFHPTANHMPNTKVLHNEMPHVVQNHLLVSHPSISMWHWLWRSSQIHVHERTEPLVPYAYQNIPYIAGHVQDRIPFLSFANTNSRHCNPHRQIRHRSFRKILYFRLFESHILFGDEYWDCKRIRQPYPLTRWHTFLRPWHHCRVHNNCEVTLSYILPVELQLYQDLALSWL
mmetsp:Transcript_18701/g.25935  ORF Transcript_18701/g.25935 Transcript_18701/m.25935 type:complete len:293 (+) Transcript_18701:204-1082(+)